MSLYKEVQVILIIDKLQHSDCKKKCKDCNCGTETQRLRIEVGSDSRGATFADFREAVEKLDLEYTLNPDQWILEIFDKSMGLYVKLDTNDYYSEVIPNRSKIRARRIPQSSPLPSEENSEDAGCNTS